MILAGDVGGTNTRLALFHPDKKLFTPVEVEVFPSQRYESLAAVVQEFLKTREKTIAYACFGVAGPVINGRCETPNLAWVIDGSELSGRFDLKRVEVINDLEANAYGISLLKPDDFSVLNRGEPYPGGQGALISAGTGLGEAGLYWKGDHYEPFPSEGGHASFAPRNKVEIELLLYLMHQFDHVSFERVLSGPGLNNIYRFLRDTGKGEESADIAEALSKEDPAAVISKAAHEGTCELCERALDLFAAIYGAEAGNLALKFMAVGGLYIGGGIAPKIIQKLGEGTFMKAFTAKGRMQPLLEPVPVRVILNENTALLGAAWKGIRAR